MLLHEKADQAQTLLVETDLGYRLTFARETDLHPDPGVEQVVGLPERDSNSLSRRSNLSAC